MPTPSDDTGDTNGRPKPVTNQELKLLNLELQNTIDRLADRIDRVVEVATVNRQSITLLNDRTALLEEQRRDIHARLSMIEGERKDRGEFTRTFQVILLTMVLVGVMGPIIVIVLQHLVGVR